MKLSDIRDPVILLEQPSRNLERSFENKNSWIRIMLRPQALRKDMVDDNSTNYAFYWKNTPVMRRTSLSTRRESSFKFLIWKQIIEYL